MFQGNALLVYDSYFESCTSSTSGGAINHGMYGQAYGSTTLVNTKFIENESVLGGAVALLCASTDEHFVSGSFFERNVAAFMPSIDSGGMGEDIYLNYGLAKVTDSSFSGSRAANMGGAIYSLSSTFSVTRSTFSGSHGKKGGALALASGNNIIKACEFFGVNATDLGGAIFVPVTAPAYAYKNEDMPTELIISDSHFTQCTSTLGGGMYVDVGVPLEMRSSNFTLCRASDSGGGIYAASLAASTIQGANFNKCSAGFSGGAVAIVDGTVSVDSCTFLDCSVSVVVETSTCVEITMTDLYGDGWQGSKLYVMSLQEFVALKEAGLDLTKELTGLSTDDNGDSSTFTTRETSLVSGPTFTTSVCFSKNTGEDFVVVTTADDCKSLRLIGIIVILILTFSIKTDSYEGAFTVTSMDGATSYISNGAFARVCKYSPSCAYSCLYSATNTTFTF